jgi:predicted PurR-regulated permease PerM
MVRVHASSRRKTKLLVPNASKGGLSLDNYEDVSAQKTNKKRNHSNSLNSSQQKTIDDSSSDFFNQKNSRSLRKNISFVFIILLMGLVVYSLLPFVITFLSSFIVYFLFRPLHRWFVSKKISHGLSAGLTIIAVILVIVLPLYFGSKLLISEVSMLNINSDSFSKIASSSTFNSLNIFIQKLVPSFNLTEFLKNQLLLLGSFVQSVIVSAISNVARMVINLILFFFVLFYLFKDNEIVSKKSKYFLPFSDEHREIIYSEFKKITNSTVIATGGIGFLQGLLMAVGFWIFGIPSPVLWGFISMIFAMLPIVGISFIWIPATAYLFLVPQSFSSGIGLAIWGFIVTNSDYVFLRPYIQKRVGKLHPLISLIGIFIGLPVFGILGLILGPLMLSMLIVFAKIYLEENVVA